MSSKIWLLALTLFLIVAISGVVSGTSISIHTSFTTTPSGSWSVVNTATVNGFPWGTVWSPWSW